MSDRIGYPKDRFSHDAAHIIIGYYAFGDIHEMFFWVFFVFSRKMAS